MKLFKICFLLTVLNFCFFVSYTNAQINLDVGIIHKKEVNKELVLTNELYSVEEFNDNKFAIIKMNIGIQVEINVNFIKGPVDSYGPEPYIKITGNILNERGVVLYQLGLDKEIRGLLGKTIRLSCKIGENEMIELLLTPKIS